MKKIRNRLYLTAIVLIVIMTFVPLRVSAAEQDQVILDQDGSGVAVSLNMSDAEEENITAVSVSFNVDAGGNGLVTVDFEFSPELDDAECGFRYFENNDNTGRLDIYAVTGHEKSLFREGGLNLGNMKVIPTTASQSLLVEVSYCEGSFQTANAAYGDKTPVVENSEPVSIRIGGDGAQKPDNPGNDGAGGDGPGSGGSGETGPGNGGSGGNGSGSGDSGEAGPGSGDTGNEDSGDGGSGDGNIDEGLYDENTQFKNDPSDAGKIPSDIIGTGTQPSTLPDMSKGLGNSSGIKLKAAGSGTAKTTGNGKVTVMAPEDGMSGIVISKADGDASGTGQMDESRLDENGEGGDEKEVEEIMLDRENGGVAGERKEEKKSGLLTVVIIVVIVAAVLLGLGIFIFIKKKKEEQKTDRKRAGRRTAGKKDK